MPIVSPSDFLVYLDDDSAAAQAAAPSLLEEVEARFCADCGRTDAPFQLPESGRVETHDGTGSSTLFLKYPVGTLTSVKLGYDITDPDETLDITDHDVLIYAANSRRLVRRDGVFGERGLPRYVHVTYTTASDVPVEVALAIKEMAAALYRHRGAEGVGAERLGSYSVEIGRLTEALPSWRAAVTSQMGAVV